MIGPPARSRSSWSGLEQLRQSLTTMMWRWDPRACPLAYWSRMHSRHVPLLLQSFTVSRVVLELEPRHPYHQQLGNKASLHSLRTYVRACTQGRTGRGLSTAAHAAEKGVSEQKTSAMILTATRTFDPSSFSAVYFWGYLGRDGRQCDAHVSVTAEAMIPTCCYEKEHHGSSRDWKR